MPEKSAKDTLGYQLAYVCRSHRQKTESLLSELGLHIGQDMLLMQLWQQDGCMQTELVERLCVQPATITKSLDRMEAAGFVERRPDSEDRRVSRVYVTEAGWALQQRVDAIWNELDAATFGSLTPEEYVILSQLITKLRRNLSG